MDKLYIGISGKMGSGKSTLTKNIIEALSQISFETVSLATPIKNIQYSIYSQLGLTMKGEKDRELLIALGLWGRGKNANLWLNQAVLNFKKSDAEIVICDDVRFKNEADWFNKNGLLIRLEGEQRGDNVDPLLISSTTETALDEYYFEHIIDNNNTEEETALSALYMIATRLGLESELIGGLTKQLKEG